MSQSQPSTAFLEKHRKAVWAARIAYAAIMISFVTVVAVAVNMVMDMEKNKTTFKAIKVAQPISYFDKTYLDDKGNAAEPQPTPEKAPQ